MEAIGMLLDRDLDHLETVEEIIMTLQGFIILQAYYGDIVAELKKLAFVNSPPEVQLHRLVALVESQCRTMEEKLNKVYETTNVIDPIAGHVSALPTKFDDSKVSFGGAFEALCENIELGLRFILHSRPLPARPSFQPAHGPFHDPEVEKFGTLAGIWRVVAETWANMRYRDWRWSAVQGRPRCCVPSDPAALLREHAGAIRYQMFLQDRIIRRTGVAEGGEYLRCLEATAASVTVPGAGVPWSGAVDLELMGRLCALSPIRLFVQEYVDHRHYLPLIDRVNVGSVGWREWVAGKEILYCLADVLSRAATDQVPEDDLACMRQVVVVPEDVISDILVSCGRLTGEQARDLLDVLRFDPNRKSLEVWDQPLIPCGAGLVFLVPAFAKTGSPARALENFVTQWGGVSFDVRGTPFEEYVLSQLFARSTARAERGIKLQRPGERDLEFDVVASWEGYVLLLEAKCEKAVFSPAEYHRAKGQIDRSIDQLILRRRALPGVWSALREKAPSLGLPEDYVGDDRVLCISITNIMDFTGYARNGVVVTDDSCLFRFFGDRLMRFGRPLAEDAVEIRAGQEPHPSELLQYLSNPPQMRYLTGKMRLTPRVVPAITERTPGFLTAHVEFNE
jgi:hypothetical protein